MCETCIQLKYKLKTARSYHSQTEAAKELLRHKLSCHPLKSAGEFFTVTKKTRRQWDQDKHQVKSYALYTCEPSKGTLLLNMPWGEGNLFHVVLAAGDKKSAVKAAKKILESYV